MLGRLSRALTQFLCKLHFCHAIGHIGFLSRVLTFMTPRWLLYAIPDDLSIGVHVRILLILMQGET